MCFKWFEENKRLATMPLRIVLATIFIVAGYGKLMNLEGTGQFFGNLGIPLAGFFAIIVALVEFLGGIALLVGIVTRHVAALLSIVMVVAILTAHLGGGYEKALLALGGSLTLLFIGAGELSFDKKFFNK